MHLLLDRVGRIGQLVQMLNQITNSILGYPANIPEDTSSMRFTVDGVAITAMALSRERTRLSCTVAAQMPAEEAAVRQLLGMYFRYCDQAGGVLCSDKSGALMLWMEIGGAEESDDTDTVTERISAFCNAAVHWTRVCRGFRSDRTVSDLQRPLMFP
jgi:hypothetical protein